MAMTRKHRTHSLSVFIRRKRTARREQERAARRAVRETKRDTSLELVEVHTPIGFWFNRKSHGLTLEQCRLATALLRRRDRENPIRGMSKQAQFRRALRIAGIVSAVKGGRVGNVRWGRSMVATKGGNAMRDHALHHLRAISPLGCQAAKEARTRKQALQHWERTGEVMPLEPQEQAVWPQQQYPKDFMSY